MVGSIKKPGRANTLKKKDIQRVTQRKISKDITINVTNRISNDKSNDISTDLSRDMSTDMSTDISNGLTEDTSNVLSSLLSLNLLSPGGDKNIPFTDINYQEHLQIKKQQITEILLENRLENSKEHDFTPPSRKRGTCINKQINNINKNIVSKYKRKIKLYSSKNEKQNETNISNNIIDIENAYIPPDKINLNVKSEKEYDTLKKIIRPKKKEKIVPIRINCRQSVRIKNKQKGYN